MAGISAVVFVVTDRTFNATCGRLWLEKRACMTRKALRWSPTITSNTIGVALYAIGAFIFIVTS